MPGKRTALALLLVAFLIGTVAGGTLLSRGGPGGSSVASAGPEDLAKPAQKPKPKPTPAPRALTASAVLDGGGKITISGAQKPAKTGTKLTVQRREGGGWVDFPAGSTVGSGGQYSLWLQTSRKGEMSFRVIDKASGETSNPVVVTL